MENREDPSRFYDKIAELVETTLVNIFKHEKINSSTCSRIFQAIFNTIADVFTTAKLHLSNEAINYIAQQFYDDAEVNGNVKLDPFIFTKRAYVANIQTHELEFLAVFYRGTLHLADIMAELKKR